ncbi:MAG: hypothetical protein JNM24_15550 [Bdellovibrionaceae bacterium]|jgi:hypothetical protein|nr:hypothetical protein [Pseudobdellovibrionaceae bacterium]
MQKLSFLTNLLTLGNKASAASTLRACNIDGTGGVTVTPGGADLCVSNGGGGADAQFAASRVWNAVWNDVVDFQLVCDEVVYGKCYFDTFDGAKICQSRCQKSVIGIASDTFGFAVGRGRYPNEVPIAIGGWVLAFVDKIYEPGTVLTCDTKGDLTEMTLEEKQMYPERIVGIYKKPEYDEFFGPEKTKVKVNGRHWVKVK